MTTLGPDMAQIDYRLRRDAGCSLGPVPHQRDGHHHEHQDAQVAYRLDGADRAMEWIGDGLREVGITPGTVLDDAGVRAARLLADGRDPRRRPRAKDGVLVKRKKATDPRAKLPALPLVQAVRAAAEAAGVSPEAFLAGRAQALVDARAQAWAQAREEIQEGPQRAERPAWAVARYGRLQRGVARQEARQAGDLPDDVDVVHTAPVRDLERLAGLAGIDLADLYDAEQLATAREHRDATVDVGNRGYDLTLDLPKSYSVLMAMATPEVAAELEEVYLAAVRETVTAVQGWAGYGMRGHHGDGQTAQRVETSGLLGWMTVHRTARPVDGAAPDPHLHAHVTILNLVRGTDGRWSTIGAGGRDLHRHAHAADSFLRARLRAVTSERWGVRWARDARTGAWEITGVPEQLRKVFTKRQGQISEELKKAGLTLGDGRQGDDDAGEPARKASTAQAKQAAADSREAKRRPGPGGDLRADWHAQAAAAGVDPAAVVAAAMPGPGPAPTQGPGNGPGLGPDRGPDRVPVPGQAGPPPAELEQPAPVQLEPGDVLARVDAAAVAAQVLAGPAPEIGVKGGLTEHRKVVTRADVLAAAMDAVPDGLQTLAEGERLTDAVLAERAVAVALPAAGARHLTNSARYTSAEIVAAERAVLTAAADRHAAGYAQVPGDVVELAIAQYEATATADPAAPFQLSAEQRAVVTRLATGGNGVETVVGVAGAGKTTLMAVLRAAHEAAGHTVAGASVAAAAAKNLHTESGIASRTVASWLARIDTHGAVAALAGVDVLVVDEAAMVDDRDTARLLAAAGVTGTQVIAIGDPLQLRAIGVGGTFAAVHQLIRGGELTENRRQRDDVERAALAAWRTGQRATAVAAWAASGRVHVADQADDVLDTMATAWHNAQQIWADPHDRIEHLLLLAHTNADVDALNHRARGHARDVGELIGPDHTWQIGTGPAAGHRAGTTLRLAVGDQVMTLTNDHDLGVLNGERGIITAIDPGRVQVERRETGPDGPVLVRTWLPAGYLTAGGLTHAYAITAAKAQGLTADRALVYGNAMDAHVLYPAMSRDRARVDLYLALAPLEDDATRARHGTPTDTDRLARTVAAYTATLDTPPDTLVSTDLGWTPPVIHHVDQAADVEHVDQADAESVAAVEPVEHVDVDQAGRVDAEHERIRRAAAAAARTPRWPRTARQEDGGPAVAGREAGVVDQVVLAELEEMGRRRYGWPSDELLERYLEDGYVLDPADIPRRRQLRWRNPIQYAGLVARAAEAAMPLLDAAAAHQAAAQAADQVAAMHAPRIADLIRRLEERRILLRQARARADRRLIGRLHRGDLADAQDAHDRALHTYEQVRHQVDTARACAGADWRQAGALVEQAGPHLDRVGLTHHERRGLTVDQLRDRLTELVQATADEARQAAGVQPDLLAAVAAELAHRETLPTRARQAADAERRLQHAASVVSPGMRLAAIATSPGRHSPSVAARWQVLADRIDPRLTADDAWPDLADAIDRVRAAGTDPAELLPRLTGPDNPLPDEHTARALRHRLVAAHPAAVDPVRTWAVPASSQAPARYDHWPSHDLGRRGPSRGR